MNCYNTECPICLNIPKDNDIIIKTLCGHFICFTCLENSGYTLRNCPLCRIDVNEATANRFKSNEELFKMNENNCPHCRMKAYKERNVD